MSQPVESSPEIKDWIAAFYGGIFFIVLAVWAGPRLARGVSWLTFLDNDDVQFLFGFLGAALISNSFGILAEMSWKSDGAWSPRVFINTFFAFLAGAGAAAILVFWLLVILGREEQVGS